LAKLKEQYVTKLLALSEDVSTLKTDLRQVILLRDTLEDPEVHAFLTDPSILDLTKKQFFIDSFSDKLSSHFVEFLYYAIQHNQELLIIPVLNEYIDRANRFFRKVEVKVVSAAPLDEIQIQSIDKVLSKKLNLNIVIRTEVDPKVIGGFYCIVNGRIYDGTVRHKLKMMKKTLIERNI
jgi:F-type H+-transporting ATPase subunit delta